MLWFVSVSPNRAEWRRRRRPKTTFAPFAVMKKLQRAFLEVRSLILTKFPEMAGIGVYVGCPVVEEQHRRSSRQYMHVNHVSNMICCARAAYKLPIKNIRGLFLHEYGHLIAPTWEECDADLSILQNFGIEIRYKGKKELQEV